MYEDRTAAGRILSEQLVSHDIRPGVVLAVPSGGINVARPITDRFDADLGLIVAEPIRTASTRHGPVGAVTDTGVAWIDDDLVATFDIDREQLDVEKQRAFREARDKHEIYGEVVDDPTPAGTVVIVDEGLVSTLEMKANISAVEQVEGSYTVVATPLGIPSDVAQLHAFADEVVVGETVSETRLLGQFYEDFDRPVLPAQSSSD